MTTRIFTLAAAAILFMVASVDMAPAVMKKNPSPNPTRVTKNAPLTEGECRGLGGDVVTTTGCPTGTACQTADKDGALHRVCIDNAKH
jgi:hypothetical protein